MDKVDRVTNALRDALTAYAVLEPQGTARVIIALYEFDQRPALAVHARNVARSDRPRIALSRSLGFRIRAGSPVGPRLFLARRETSKD